MLTAQKLQGQGLDQRAIDILVEAGVVDDGLFEYSIDDLTAIHGIGPKYAQEIRSALDVIASPAGSPQPDKAAAAFNHALALLTNCGRRGDVANLKVSTEPVDAKVENAINILENLEGGDLGRNLAAQVKGML
ncbi:MAG: hypothetical protein AAF609_23290 [Cyanobacteria bacterium P01_C01_bin.120]